MSLLHVLGIIKYNTKIFWLKTYRFILRSHSQYGEDIILDKLLANRKDGFFIDIGANHPTVLSNTLRFHNKGWVGINVEPNPVLFEPFEQGRPDDINLNIGVGPINGEMSFYRISADTLSTFNEDAAHNAVKDGHTLLDTIDVPVIRLDSLIEKHCKHREIDFMSIDVEGFEMQVLESNDWSRFRPYFLIVEVDKGGDEIRSFLKDKKYVVKFDNGTNCIFMDSEKIS